MMNNFERMESVQQSLEQLASAKGKEAKVDDNAQVNDQRVNGENENQINAQSEGQNQEETKGNQNSETVAASGSVKASSDKKNQTTQNQKERFRKCRPYRNNSVSRTIIR